MITLKFPCPDPHKNSPIFKNISIIKKTHNKTHDKTIKQHLEYKGSLPICKERMDRKDKCPHIKNMLKNPKKTHRNSEKVLAFSENLCYSITS